MEVGGWRLEVGGGRWEALGLLLRGRETRERYRGRCARCVPHLCEAHVDQVGEEDALVPLADAVAHGRAVVVKPTDTLIAHLLE